MTLEDLALPVSAAVFVVFLTVLEAGLRRRDRTLLGPAAEGDLPDTTLPLVAALLLYVLVTWGVQSALPPADRRPVWAGVAATHGIGVLFAAGLLPFAVRGSRSRASRRGVTVARGLVAGLAVFSVTVLLGLAIELGHQAFGVETPRQGVVTEAGFASGVGLAVMATVALLAAPFAEEVFYRGILFPAVAAITGVRRALLLQAAVFGLIHVMDDPVGKWPLAIPLGFVGWAAGALYHRTGSLLAPIALHAVFNGIYFALIRAGM